MIAEKLGFFAASCPDKLAFIVEGLDACEHEVSFGTLYKRVRSLAFNFQERKLPGRSVVLVYQNVIEFIYAFLACQLAGVTAIPAAYGKNEKQISRLKLILNNASCNTVLCSADLSKALGTGLADDQYQFKHEIISTNLIADAADGNFDYPGQEDPIAFIQYTSGSTNQPKGVIITSKNLMHNQRLLQQTFGCDSNSVIVSWLPFNHDMGLIGNILHAVYVGCTCVLMAPVHFIQKPLRWFDLITKYKATHSGGPDFAYRHCCDKLKDAELSGIDLSSWRVAYSGSEPVRCKTIDDFSRQFNFTGVTKKVFTPCYGLAEATLLVSAVKPDLVADAVDIAYDVADPDKVVISDPETPGTVCLVSSGEPVAEFDVKIRLTSGQWAETELQKGGIYISGPSVTSGYLNADNSEFFCDYNGEKFLNTGDIGFFFKKQLYICGRAKEMLILRGRNYYPQDIEQTAVQDQNSFISNGVAVFSINRDDEKLVMLAEIKREHVRDDLSKLINTLQQQVAAQHEIEFYDILIVPPNTIPRTTSGKLQRLKCSDAYVNKQIKYYASLKEHKINAVYYDIDGLVSEILTSASQENIERFLTALINIKAPGIILTHNYDNLNLTELGIDSLRSMEIINAVNKYLSININAIEALQNGTLTALINLIENMLWLKKNDSSGKEIMI